jgi:hypothetical protein
VNILFPSGYYVEVSKLRQQLDQAHLAWWKEWQDSQPKFAIENIRFEHDPLWNKRFFSIQSAHDLNHWVWKATSVIWMGMGGSI